MKLNFLKLFCLILVFVLLSGCSTTKGETKMYTHENTKIGEKIKFGSLNNEKIEWQILSVKENKALIITTEGIDSKLYNAQAIETNWESCSLRKW